MRSGLTAHLAGRSLTICYMLRLDLRDGATIALTDHNQAIEYDLGDGQVTYSAADGMNLSDITLVTGFDASNFEASGPIGDTFTRAQVIGGRFRGAIARLFMVDWSDPTDHLPIMRGKVGECRVEGLRWVLEVRNAADAFNQTQGGVLMPYCRTYFGSSECGITRTPYSATIIDVESESRFLVDIAGAHDDKFFVYGNVAFETGELAGIDEAKILKYDDADGRVKLYEPLFQTPEVGDTVTLYRGCSRLLKAKNPDLPTCRSYDNVINFRGHPEVPGSRFYHRVSGPGTAYA